MSKTCENGKLPLYISRNLAVYGHIMSPQSESLVIPYIFFQNTERWKSKAWTGNKYQNVMVISWEERKPAANKKMDIGLAKTKTPSIEWGRSLTSKEKL